MKTKNCRRCKEDKPVSMFHSDKRNTSDGLYSWCKPCKTKKSSEWQRNNPGRKKDMYLKRTYSITLEDYNKMREEQNFSCFICSTPEESLKRPLLVDHCHSTGKNRNLLCDRCNTMLGKLEENVKIMENMIDYIKKHKS